MTLATIEQAEKVAGQRLDRRRNYRIIDGEVCDLARWTQACSGCYEGLDSMKELGGGCDECGYTGKRRQGFWAPILLSRN